MNRRFLVPTILSIILISAGIVSYATLHHKIEKEVARGYKKITKHLPLALTNRTPGDFPEELRNVPLADKSGIIVGIKNIEIRNVTAAYNPSLIEVENGYLIFFREDTPDSSSKHSYFPHIGYAYFDRSFNQTEQEFGVIDTGSRYSEDPRIFRTQKDTFLVYNDLLPHVYDCRTMRIAKIDLKSHKLSFITDLDQHIQSIEKNWVPFEFNGDVHFAYRINPHKILQLRNPRTNAIDHLTFAGNPGLQRLPWPHMFGELRGGTPASLIGDEYLSFFHSFFKDRNGFFWYVMGAYTFEAKPPFRVTSISPYPILFQDIYTTSHRNTADWHKRIIFPSGMVVEKSGDKTLVHVSCGENDSAIKIVTFDQKALLKSLRKI